MNILAAKNLLQFNEADWKTAVFTDASFISSEIWLVIAMCLVLIVPLFGKKNAAAAAGVTVAGLIVALACIYNPLTQPHLAFSGHLMIDGFSRYFKLILYTFTALVIYMWWHTGRQDTKLNDTPDFLCLILGATIGMSLMASANSLLMMFVAMETASMPSYALAGFKKKTKLGSEGAMKYLVFGSASSAVMIYGMSLVYTATGSLYFGEIAAHAANGISPMLAIGLAGTISGLLFKLSAAPLHFWCPDVFQAAPTVITTFLSVASKGGAICLLVRFMGSFGAIQGATFNGLATGVAIVGVITAFVGNLAALKQTNLKRMLAFSSISHAGFMISCAALLAVADKNVKVPAESAILFYMLVYMFMNLGAFTCVALIKKHTGGEELKNVQGLIKRSPILACLFGLCLLSLFGLPGLGGFMAKFYLFGSFDGNEAGGLFIITMLLINTLISLFYYIKPLAFAVFKKDPQQQGPITLKPASTSLIALMSFFIVISGFNPDFFMGAIVDSGKLAPTVSQPAQVQQAAQQIEHQPVSQKKHTPTQAKH